METTTSRGQTIEPTCWLVGDETGGHVVWTAEDADQHTVEGLTVIPLIRADQAVSNAEVETGAISLTDAEREQLGDVWDADTTDSVAAFYPVVEAIIGRRVQESRDTHTRDHADLGKQK